MSDLINLNNLNELTGPEKMQHFVDQAKLGGMAKNLAYTNVSHGEGHIEFNYQLKDRHINLIGTLHGGIMATLLDTAMGAAVSSLLAKGERHTMSDITTKFVRPVSDASDVLTIKAEVEHAGRRTFVTAGTIHNSQGKLVARAIGSAMKI